MNVQTTVMSLVRTASHPTTIAKLQKMLEVEFTSKEVSDAVASLVEQGVLDKWSFTDLSPLSMRKPLMVSQDIVYWDDQEAHAFSAKNVIFCDAINSGTRFSIVFTSPMERDDSGEVKICVATNWHYKGDLHNALVVLEGKQVMPYPIFEEALGAFFMLEEIQALESLEDTGQVLATQQEFCDWLEAIFGDQFAGLVESWSGEKSHRRTAIAFAASVARGPKAILAKYKDYLAMHQAVERLEYSLGVFRHNKHPEMPEKGVLGVLRYVRDVLLEELSNGSPVGPDFDVSDDVRLVMILCESAQDFERAHQSIAAGSELIQFPETGLGPRLQLEKGDELIRMSREKRITIWTTSEHIVLRARRRVVETNAPGFQVEDETLLITEKEFEVYYLHPETQKLLRL